MFPQRHPPPIATKSAYRLRKLRRSAGLIVWAGSAALVLAIRPASPIMPLLLVLLAPPVLASGVPLLVEAWREHRAARAARPYVRTAAQALLRLNGDAALQALYQALAVTHLGPPALGPVIHNVGTALVLTGQREAGQEWIARARASGWVTPRAIREGERLLRELTQGGGRPGA